MQARSRLSLLGCALCALLPSTLLAQTPNLVKDIRTAPPVGPSSTPQDFVREGVNIWFTADTDAAGRELYRSIAGATGQLVLDIRPGGDSSSPSELTPVGNQLFFIANDGVNGSELWVSDGSAGGTSLVLDINPGSSSSGIEYLTAVGNRVFFEANDGSNGSELWVSDGTAAGTSMVKDINPGSSSSTPEELCAYQGKVIFSATDGGNNQEPWISDGTAAGTQMILDINPGFSSTPSSEFVEYKGLVYFRASDGPTGNNGFELWRTDGTAAGTVLFADLRSGSRNGSYPAHFTVIGSKMYFVADGDVGGTRTGTEPWVTDGTLAGTWSLGDLRSGTSSSTSWSGDSPQFTEAGGKVFFIANGSAGTSTTGNEVYVTDGTAGSAALLVDIRSGSSSSSPDFLTSLGSVLLFSADNNTDGDELWLSDGTVAGTGLAFDFYPGSGDAGPSGMIGLGNGQALVGMNDGVVGKELFVTDGTLANTRLIANIEADNPNATLGSTPVFVTEVNGRVFFRAIDDTHGNELWVSDGSAAGTVLVKDINPGSGSSTPQDFAVLGDKLFFIANDGVTGYEPYVTDGTAAGTVMLGEIRPGTSSISVGETVVMGGRVFFDATTSTDGNELWVSDGTKAGTMLLKDIYTGTSGSNPTHLLATGDTVFFTARTTGEGYELWKTNGTTAGTVMVKDIKSGTSSGMSTSSSRRGVILGDESIFVASGSNGNELWISDGTAAGTVELKDIRSGSSSSTPGDLCRVGDKVFFSANDGTVGTELWVTDGTAAGTVLVKDLRTGSSSAGYDQFVALGDKLFFECNYDGSTSSVGYEPFISDGTAAGTFMLKDTRSGSSSANVNFPAAVGSRYVFFNVNDGVHGTEVWRTDGTSAGTVRLTDLNPGSNSASPNYFTVSRGVLFFKADDGVTGAELYTMDIGATAQAKGQGYDAGAVPTLLMDDPVLGGTTGLRLGFARASALSIGVVGLPGPVASLPGGLDLHFDVTRPFVLFGFNTDASGAYQTSFPVPNNASLTGLLLRVQVGVDAPGLPPMGVATSNAVELRLDNQ